MRKKYLHERCFATSRPRRNWFWREVVDVSRSWEFYFLSLRQVDFTTEYFRSWKVVLIESKQLNFEFIKLN